MPSLCWLMPLIILITIGFKKKIKVTLKRKINIFGNSTVVCVCVFAWISICGNCMLLCFPEKLDQNGRANPYGLKDNIIIYCNWLRLFTEKNCIVFHYFIL